MIICKLCNAEFSSDRKLTWHLKNNHNINRQTYYDMFFKKSNEGICLTCGKPTKFISGRLGYRSHCNKKCMSLDKNVQIKRLSTNLEIHGYLSSFSTKETQDKIKKTHLERRGVENPFQAEDVKEKIRKTKEERYGDPNYNNHEKATKTNMERYNDPCSLRGTNIEKVEHIILNKYNAKNIWASEYGKQKIKDTNNQRYGCDNPQQNREIHIKTMKHYKYNNIYFDSSWELAVYIWYTDNNIPIEREPCTFTYIGSDNKQHIYFPDFKINDDIIEIKGDQYLDENGKLIDKYKQKCIEENNVLLWTRKTIQPYIEYCINKYNDKLWYKQFK